MPARSKISRWSRRCGGQTLLAALALAAVCGCGSDAVPLRLTLVAGPDLPVGLRSLRVVVREAARDRPDVYGPFALRDELTIPLAVRPGVPFYADLLGCNDRTACTENDVIARGCTEVIEVERTAELEVVLHEVSSDAAQRCPPALP